MSTKKEYEFAPIGQQVQAKATHLPSCVANGIMRLTGDHIVALDLITESWGDEGVFYPAQHIHIYGRPHLIALRDFINRTLERKDSEDVYK